MHIAKRFEAENLEQVGEQINAIRFGTLVHHDGETYDATPVPWVATREGNALLLWGHLANANPLLDRFRLSSGALVTFTGANGYLSPRGLPTPRGAPTWNYIAVHVHGSCELLDERETEIAVEKLVAAMEKDRPDPWQSSEMESRREQLLRYVTGVCIRAEKLEAKFKLGQNESDIDLPAILCNIEREGRRDLAAMMREANRERLAKPVDQQRVEEKA